MIQDVAYCVIFLGILAVIAPMLGRYMAAVFQGRRNLLSRMAGPLERLIYRVCRIDEKEEMTWKGYTRDFLYFSGISLAVLLLLQFAQGRLPLNPQGFGPVRWDTAINTAISFVTNTNWQAYGGETTMTYLTQMAGLTVQNFVSAAAGIAVALPLIRAFTARLKETVGNFWVDMTRAVVYILLPLSLILAVVLVSQGVVQSFGAYPQAHTLEGGKQAIALGPAAGQVAVKQLGSNGGGFFNANSAHPFENPTPLSNLLEMLSILLIPMALTFTFGTMIKNSRQGMAIFAAMLVLFLVGLSVALAAEWQTNPAMARLGVVGGNMEGKEVRFGIGPSVLWGEATSVTSNGSINAMHDSMMPLTGLVYMFNIAVGEVIFGGVGVGLIGMLMYAILTLFLAGLMIGRTPEFLGKKLESREMIMAVIVVIAPAIASLIFAALAAATKTGLASLNNAGPHGLSEILYAYFSAAGNNGSAFAGLNANTPFYNLTTGFVMLVGRFLTVVPALAIAGSLAGKKTIPPSSATFPTASALFVGMLVGVVIIVGALTFFPALVLGPVLEHLLLSSGRIFWEDIFMEEKRITIWQSGLMRSAAAGSFRRLDPRLLWRNPVMFVVECVSVVTTVISINNLFSGGPFWFNAQITVWLWFTVLFANFAEALAEGRGKAQAESLRKAQSEAYARKVYADGRVENVSALALRKNDIVLMEDGDPVPGDGEIVEGVALVDESAVTGESAPVIREAKGDRSAVTGGTRILSGRIRVMITANPGETFLDHMISMVESAKRQKTPNEVALEILLVGLTVLFIVVVATLLPFAAYGGVTVAVTVLIALLVCLIPTTIGGLLPAIGIAGMDRLIQHNVIALSGRAVEASGDVDIVLLDKTGTITLGNRMATDFMPAVGVTAEELAEAALLSSLADETPEGRSIVALAKHRLGVRGRDIKTPDPSCFVPFTPELRMSGVSLDGREIRKGATDAVALFVQGCGGEIPESVEEAAARVGREGGTPLVVAESERALGVIQLKDVLKEGIKERLHQLRLMGISSTMITGDNPLTAAAIAAEAGIDDFVAQARPEEKLRLIRKYQGEGHLVAMIGDGTNDAPALAQADVAVAMNAGTQASREAANMVDLDSNPTKLLDIVEIGKQILMTRGALTTFSVANDVSKYFAIIPAIFVGVFPVLAILNIMHLATPQSAILSAIIFNAVIIPLLIPLALKGIKYRPITAQALLWRNLVIYGFGGLALPFVGIKLIDMIVVFLHLA